MAGVNTNNIPYLAKAMKDALDSTSK